MEQEGPLVISRDRDLIPLRSLGFKCPGFEQIGEVLEEFHSLS